MFAKIMAEKSNIATDRFDARFLQSTQWILIQETSLQNIFHANAV